MEPEKRRLIIEGNSLYEIDLECMNRRQNYEGRSMNGNNNNMYPSSYNNNQLNKRRPYGQ